MVNGFTGMTVMSKTDELNKDGFQKCLVIGGAGMLGYEIVTQLLREGKFRSCSSA